MSVYGVPTYLSHLRLASATGQLRQQAETARSEVVTGRKADLAKTLGHAAGEAHLLGKAIGDLSSYRSAISRADLRTGAVQSVLTDLRSSVSGLGADMSAALARHDEAAIATNAVVARSDLETAFSRLNVRVEGLSVFAGDAADGPALGNVVMLVADIAALYGAASSPAQFETDLDFYFNDPAGGFATNIYLGGAGALSGIEIDNGEVIVGAAKADEQPVKDLLRGLAVASVAGSAPATAMRDSVLAAASKRLFEASDSLVEVQTRIGLEQQRAGKASDRHDAEEPALTAAYNALTARDPYEAASFLQSLEAQIDAAYVLTSRLSQLTLTNYLR
ncbi:MAG: hypothetical protein KDA46_10855 [Parvularculaceae bacterium]|nr:hypothetical protein [Parvularculaceae bacterium]